MRDFLNTLSGKVIAILTIIALVFGVVAEGVSIYRNGQEAKTAAETANNAAKLKLAEAEERSQLAKKAAADAETARATAANAERLKVAEAEERAQLAKKAASEAEAAKAAADNAAKLRLAEAEEKAQLAKKAAADAETARETANNAGKLKLAEAQKLAADAEAAKELAKKAAADAETARAAANNAGKLKLAEAQKLAADAEAAKELAKKAAFDAEKSAAEAKTAEAVAENSKRRQQAEATSAEAKARFDTADANIQEYVNGVLAHPSGKGLAADMTNAVLPKGLGGRGYQAAAQPTPSQAPALPSLHVKSDASLNLRNGPGLGHNILAELPAGTSLHRVGACIPSDDGVTHDPWCKVEWNGTTGWASSSGLESVQQ